ncbi:MAG: 50S ribosomal protein L21 [Candidatus Acetothermia bacterium]
MYAIIETGGKQYWIEEGATVKIEKLPDKKEGDEVTFNEVLFVKDEDTVSVGRPYLSGTSVNAEVVEKGKDEKITVFKYKKRKGYRRTKGHRQPYMKVQVNSIASEE